MGYTSEVSLTLKTNDFNNLIAKTKSESIQTYEFITEGAEIYQTNQFTTIHWDWVKWYESDPEIEFIEKFRENVSFVFNRIGEEIEDNESLYNIDDDDDYFDMYDCANIVRHINLSGAGDKVVIA